MSTASAQEIESHAFAFWKLHREYLTSKRTLPRPALDRAFSSAITAAVADRDTRIKNLEEFIRETQCRCEPEIGNQCERCYLLREGSLTAAVVQAKEEERLLGNLLAIIHGDGGHYQDEHGLKKAYNDAVEKVTLALMEALELKEPAPESNLSTQITLTLKSFPDAEGFWLLVSDLKPHLYAKLLWVRWFNGDWRQQESHGRWWNCAAGTWFQLPLDQLSKIVLSEHFNAAGGGSGFL